MEREGGEMIGCVCPKRFLFSTFDVSLIIVSIYGREMQSHIKMVHIFMSFLLGKG